MDPRTTTPVATSTVYNVHRWYQPGVGRYTRPDPWGIDRPEGIAHLYNYGKNRPTLFVDPEGLSPFPVWILPNPTAAEDCFYCLLARSNFGIDCTEQAAWLTLDLGPTGLSYGCQIWPPTAARGEASIPVALPLPNNIVGQAHTHPTRCPRVRRGPTPSEGDKETSRKINRPIFTVSPNGVWRYDPNSDRERRILPPNWTKGPQNRNCEPCEGIPQP